MLKGGAKLEPHTVQMAVHFPKASACEAGSNDAELWAVSLLGGGLFNSMTNSNSQRQIEESTGIAECSKN